MNRIVTASAQRLCVFLLSLALYACSADTDRVEHGFETTIADEILTAVNTGGPKYSEQLFDYEEVLRLKQDENQENSLLGDPEKGEYRISPDLMVAGVAFVLSAGGDTLAANTLSPDTGYSPGRW